MDDAFYQSLQNRCIIPGGEILTYDEVMRWPPGYREDFEKAGKIRQIENSEEIICNQCPEGCPIIPLIRTNPATGKLTGTAVCQDNPDIGRFDVDLDRRMRWEVVAEKTTIDTKPIAEPENKKTVEINLQDFSNTKSKQLLRDLIACPSGVTYSKNNHGKDQPKAFKKILKIKYPDVASDIHIDNERIYSEKFTLKEKK